LVNIGRPRGRIPVVQALLAAKGRSRTLRFDRKGIRKEGVGERRVEPRKALRESKRQVVPVSLLGLSVIDTIRVKENAVAGAKDDLRTQLIGDPDSGLKIVSVRIDQPSPDVRRLTGNGILDIPEVLSRLIEEGSAAMAVGHRLRIVIAQPEVQG